MMLAGINGAGKSTFHGQYLKELGIEYLNPDEIAKLDLGYGVNLTREQAKEVGKLVADVRDQYIEAQMTFAFETVLSDPVGEKVEVLRKAREKGYVVILFFIFLESPEIAIERVKYRVANGGHGLPEQTIRDRYPRILENLIRSVGVPNYTVILDNSLREQYELVGLVRDDELILNGHVRPRWATEYFQNLK